MLRVDRFASCATSKLFRPSGVAGAILSIDDSGDGDEDEDGEGEEEEEEEEGGGESADPRASSVGSEGSRLRLRLRGDGVMDNVVEDEERGIIAAEEGLLGLVKEGKMCGEMKSIC